PPLRVRVRALRAVRGGPRTARAPPRRPSRAASRRRGLPEPGPRCTRPARGGDGRPSRRADRRPRLRLHRVRALGRCRPRRSPPALRDGPRMSPAVFWRKGLVGTTRTVLAVGAVALLSQAASVEKRLETAAHVDGSESARVEADLQQRFDSPFTRSVLLV